MNTEELLNQCRYYRGEAQIPKNIMENCQDDFSFFWIAEEAAVRAIAEGEDETELLKDYKAIGAPEASSNVPPIFLAFLFALYCKGSDFPPEQLIESFENDFLKSYMASTVM